MPVDTILGPKKHVPNPWHGTKLVGYIESQVPRACGTCKYLEKGMLCDNHLVMRDTQIPKDQKTGLRIVDPICGCCNEWVSSEAAEKLAADGAYNKLLKVVVDG